MQQASKKTLLHDWHVAQGANMAEFGGYRMPLWYPSGAKQEHLAVLTNAGIFDTSHMAELMVTGKDAFALLQQSFSRDLNRCLGKNKTPLKPGRCVYGVFLNEAGHTIDDAIVYHLESERYMIVVNAGMGDKIAQHLTSYIKQNQVKITDLTDKIGKMDIQGHISGKILMKILKSPETVPEDMQYFSFKSDIYLKDGTQILLSRTGYTGEFGFEIFIQPEHFVKLWETILDAVKNEGIIPCGLAARDSLRAGAVLPLSHQDIGSWLFLHNPWEFALPYNNDKTGFTKEFIGDKAILKAVQDKAGAEYTYPFVGYDLRKVGAQDSAVILDSENESVGKVLTCVSDMGIGIHGNRIYSIASPDKPKDFNPAGLCCGFIKVRKRLDPGQTVELRDKRRKIKVMITEDIRPDRSANMKILSYSNSL